MSKVIFNKKNAIIVCTYIFFLFPSEITKLWSYKYVLDMWTIISKKYAILFIVVTDNTNLTFIIDFYR